MSEIATHEPAPGSDFVIRVDLSENGMTGRSEQLWAKQTGPTRFVLQSLPFFAYGLHFGDEIETDDQFTFVRVVRASGRQLLRVAASRDHAEIVHSGLHPLLEHLGMRHEWHRVGYVSVDLPSVEVPPDLLPGLEARANDGQLYFELA